MAPRGSLFNKLSVNGWDLPNLTVSFSYGKFWGMKRVTWVNIHLTLASIFLPFMLMFPLSGGLYLLDVKGGQAKTEAFKIEAPVPQENPEDFFREQFKAKNIDFDFEYIRGNGKEFTFRPSSREHYVAERTEAGATVYKLEPDFIRKIMEIHKGHGPAVIRWFQVAFAIALILVTFSGIYLAATIPRYAKIMGYGFMAGAAVLLLGLL